MTRTSILFVAIAALLASSCACKDTTVEDDKEAELQTKLFLTFLSQAKWKGAHRKLSPEMKAKCGKPKKLAKTVIKRFETKLDTWTLKKSFGSDTTRTFTAKVKTDKSKFKVHVYLGRIEDAWLIVDVDVDDKPLCK